MRIPVLPPHGFFLTFTCNMKKHFGTKPIKEWIDSNEWQKNFPLGNFHELDLKEQEEITQSVIQASSSILLRVWQEVCQLFLDYLRKSPTSPYKRVLSIFARNEYQAKAGNLSHIHLMLEVDWKKLTEEETKFVKDLCSCSVLDIDQKRLHLLLLMVLFLLLMIGMMLLTTLRIFYVTDVIHVVKEDAQMAHSSVGN